MYVKFSTVPKLLTKNGNFLLNFDLNIKTHRWIKFNNVEYYSLTITSLGLVPANLNKSPKSVWRKWEWTKSWIENRIQDCDIMTQEHMQKSVHGLGVGVSNLEQISKNSMEKYESEQNLDLRTKQMIFIFTSHQYRLHLHLKTQHSHCDILTQSICRNLYMALSFFCTCKIMSCIEKHHSCNLYSSKRNLVLVEHLVASSLRPKLLT